MNPKVPYYLVLIGVIIGFVNSVSTLIPYVMFKFVGAPSTFGTNFMDELYLNSGMFETFIVMSLIRGIAGIMISSVLIYYAVRISKKPVRKDYLTVAILGGVGLPLGTGIGGLLVLIGGVLGMRKFKKK
jgi:hypothetical protein